MLTVLSKALKDRDWHKVTFRKVYVDLVLDSLLDQTTGRHVYIPIMSYKHDVPLTEEIWFEEQTDAVAFKLLMSSFNA
jgi:hypothetical protein